VDGTLLIEIEARINQLPPEEQLLLIERLAHKLRGQAGSPQPSLQAQLEAMAHDPDIQREIREIKQEFSGTETDGLEDSNAGPSQ
jgi:hypothetical protein